jgi:hypothetical protein
MIMFVDVFLALITGLFLPASAFKAVRRAAADQLLALRHSISFDEGMPQQPVLPHMLEAAAAAADAAAADSPSSSSRQQNTSAPKLRVLCRTPGQVQAALQLPWLEEIILDFLEAHGLKQAVAAVQGAGRQAVVALPRIMKPGESRLLWFYLGLGADALLLRGAGCLQQLLDLGGPGAELQGMGALDASSSSEVGSSSGSSTVHDPAEGEAGEAAAAAERVVIPRLEGDFSLNAANVLAADLLLGSGLSRLCPTHDLNAAQLAGLAEGIGAGESWQWSAVLSLMLLLCTVISDSKDKILSALDC